MENKATQLLGVQYPIMQAAMAYISDAELAAAVCNAGGMGVLGTNPRVEKPERDAKKTGEIMRREIKKTRALTTHNFAVNYVPPLDERDTSRKYADAVKQVLAEEQVPFVVMVANMSKFIQAEIAELNSLGCQVIYREISCTVDSCLQAVEAGAKALIVTGVEAGGHVSDYNLSLLNILPLVTDQISAVPILAAGSIVNAKTAAAACALGADGVYCGTAFLAAEECCAHADFKQVVLQAKGEDVIIWRAANARMASNQNFVGRVCQALDRGGATRRDIRSHYAGTFGQAMLLGEVDKGCVSFSAGVAAINSIRPVQAIVDEIASGLSF